MNCWFCGRELIWNNDFSAEDYGHEGEGVVAVLTCPNCGTIVECTYLEENDTRK